MIQFILFTGLFIASFLTGAVVSYKLNDKIKEFLSKFKK
jgi:hypothetical protein